VDAHGNTALVRDPFDAFNDRDLDRVAAMVSEDFELVDFAAEGQIFRGPQGILRWLRMFLTALPDAKTELTSVVADGENWVFTEFVGRGTHTGPLVGPAGTIPPTGRSMREGHQDQAHPQEWVVTVPPVAPRKPHGRAALGVAANRSTKDRDTDAHEGET